MSLPELKETEKEYIADNRATMPVPVIAENLKRGAATIYAYFKFKNWKPFRVEQGVKPRDHPFRKANRRLEAVTIQRRIENRKANPK